LGPHANVESRVSTELNMRQQPTTAELDVQTIAGLKRRDPAALGDLYDRYGRIAYSVALRYLRDSSAAEDVVQEVFLRVWTRAHLLNNVKGTLVSWLITVTRNLAIDHLRAYDRDGCREQNSFEFIAVPVDFELSDNVDRLRTALTNLTQEQRRVVELAYFEGLSQTEISERVGRPLGTVKSCVRAALNKMRYGVRRASLPGI
jgi:RNA polymerase sigma-70 factor, ECF subfamily